MNLVKITKSIDDKAIREICELTKQRIECDVTSGAIYPELNNKIEIIINK